jgi:hypothetical protein
MADRIRSLFVVALALVWAATPFTTVKAATLNAAVKASVAKPVQLTSKQGLDFGQIILSGAGGTVTVSQAGARTCPAPLTCSGTVLPGILNVSGTNQKVINITAPPVDLVNATGQTLRFTPIVPSTITLTNSGNPGTDFNMGGSITLTATSADGVYSGVVTVTADYQ